MDNLRKIFEKFSQKEGFECHGKINDEMISSMERELMLSFPAAYKYFLKEFGYVEWFGHAIYGYSNDHDYRTVNNTLELREENIPSNFKRIPQDGCILESYGGGGYYFLFSNNSPRAGQVALFIDELFGSEAQSWPTFEDFLAYILSL